MNIQSDYPSNESILELYLEKLAKNAGISASGTIFQYTLNYLTFIVIARFIGPATFGLFILAQTIFRIAGMVSKLGLDQGVVRFVACYRGEKIYHILKGG